MTLLDTATRLVAALETLNACLPHSFRSGLPYEESEAKVMIEEALAEAPAFLAALRAMEVEP